MRRALTVILAFCFLQSGCAAYSALKGQVQPDVTVLESGASRSQIEAAFGNPVYSDANDFGGTSSTYQYQVADPPSPSRAVTHAVLDLMTFFLWEFAAVPSELARERTEAVAVDYDEADHAVFIRKAAVVLD